MQEVRSSNLLSSTGQKRNSNISTVSTAAKYSNAAVRGAARVFGSGVFLRLGLLAGHRIPRVEPALGQPVTWANPGLAGPVTLATWSPPGLQGGRCLPVTVAAFASGPGRAGRPGGPDPLSGAERVGQGRAFAGGRARPAGPARRARGCQCGAGPAGALRRSGAGLRRGAALPPVGALLRHVRDQAR
jgi:hypothetical protein